jgi:uncharacterized integral membrane protein
MGGVRRRGRAGGGRRRLPVGTVAAVEASRPQGSLPQPEKGGTNWRNWLIGVVVVILVIFVLLNFQTVKVNFIVGTTQTPLIVALLIAAALGALVGWLLPIVRRSRKPDAPPKD